MVKETLNRASSVCGTGSRLKPCNDCVKMTRKTRVERRGKKQRRTETRKIDEKMRAVDGSLLGLWKNENLLYEAVR